MMAKFTKTNTLIPYKDLVTRNDHLQNVSSYIYYFVIIMFIFKKSMSSVEVKRFSKYKKIISQGLFM